jgi:hypothetical protein
VPDRRGSRFALEVLFLAALAVGLAVAEARSVVIAGVMALGWLLVAGVEWAAWRGEPHFGSGLPPRWYVPRVSLPPPQPLEPVVSGYPEGRRDEAPTWIAPAALRQEMLGEWPVAAPLASEEPEPEPEEVDAAWTAVELPPEPADAEPGSSETNQVHEVDAEPEPTPEPEPSLDAELVRSAGGVARYSLDPLAEEPRRRFRRGGGERVPTIDVPARPDGVRALPGAAPSEE